MISQSVLTVKQLNFYIKSLFEGDQRLSNILVSGEISNFHNHYRSGHLYFTLKDDFAQISCVMFATNARRLMFSPEEGMQVVLRGRVSYYEKDGSCQIYVDSMQPEGAGALAVAFEQLRQKLLAQGLFDKSHKKAIPKFPKKIGVITSGSGAALRDIKNVISRRFPICELILFPVAVQGERCPAENIAAIEYFNTSYPVDTIILGRGGGSIEDLWGYNSESLVRAIFASDIPIITGIGHEIDYTLCDFVADLRAPTPSAAAELAVPDILELSQSIKSAQSRLDRLFDAYINPMYMRLDKCVSRLRLLSPEGQISIKRKTLDALDSRIINRGTTLLTERRSQLDQLNKRLTLLNPIDSLKKGKLLAFDGTIPVKSVNQLSVGSTFRLIAADGSALCEVKSIERNGETNDI